ncbi:hypothetical protein [Microbacterium sp. MM2322]|uniref:hypothetical protein n=1 Tax=Microbacterium sp. MM2322 TaxID=3157631 RepID=UPI0032D577DC
MAITVLLESNVSGIIEHETDEATEFLSAQGVWWKRNPERETDGRPFYEPSSAPYRQRSKHEWTAQLAEEDSCAMGEGARREMLEEQGHSVDTRLH